MLEKNFQKIIETKLEWAIKEKTKGLKVIEKQFQQIKENKETLLQLEGMIKILNELLQINLKKEN
jgi:hypothetical protein